MTRNLMLLTADIYAREPWRQRCHSLVIVVSNMDSWRKLWTFFMSLELAECKEWDDARSKWKRRGGKRMFFPPFLQQQQQPPKKVVQLLFSFSNHWSFRNGSSRHCKSILVSCAVKHFLPQTGPSRRATVESKRKNEKVWTRNRLEWLNHLQCTCREKKKKGGGGIVNDPKLFSRESSKSKKKILAPVWSTDTQNKKKKINKSLLGSFPLGTAESFYPNRWIKSEESLKNTGRSNCFAFRFLSKGRKKGEKTKMCDSTCWCVQCQKTPNARDRVHEKKRRKNSKELVVLIPRLSSQRKGQKPGRRRCLVRK